MADTIFSGCDAITEEERADIMDAPLTAEELAMFDKIPVGTLVNEISICRNLIENHPGEPRFDVTLARLLETEAILQNNAMEVRQNGR
jgi:hypothetical protein